MKKALYSFLLGFAALSIVSCDYNDPNDGKFNSDREFGWVEFARPGTVAVTQATCGNIEIPIILDAPVNTKGVDISYTVTDVTGSTEGLHMYASIPAGSREGAFVITNSEILTSEIEFTVTLTSTNREKVAVGSPDSVAGDQTINVRVVLGMDRFLGAYDVLENPGEYEYVSNVTLGNEANEIVLSGIYDINANTQTSVFVNEDGTLSFPEYTSNPLIAGALFVEGIEGKADPCTGEIRMRFNLVGPTGNVLESSVSVVLRRQ